MNKTKVLKSEIKFDKIESKVDELKLEYHNVSYDIGGIHFDTYQN